MRAARGPATSPPPPRLPTLFEQYRQQTGADADSCWVVANSGQVIDCHHSVAPGYGPDMGAQLRAHLTPLPDNWVWEQVEEILGPREVHLMLVNLHEIDRMAHAGNRAGYTGAVSHASAMIQGRSPATIVLLLAGFVLFTCRRAVPTRRPSG